MLRVTPPDQGHGLLALGCDVCGEAIVPASSGQAWLRGDFTQGIDPRCLTIHHRCHDQARATILAATEPDWFAIEVAALPALMWQSFGLEDGGVAAERAGSAFKAEQERLDAILLGRAG